MMQGAQTTKVMYVGPKPFKLDTVSGFRPQYRFTRGMSTEVPSMVAQSLLAFDCFVIATEASVKQAEAQELNAQLEAEALLAEQAAAKLEELDNQNTVITVDGDEIDVLKLNFGQIQTLCLAQELDVQREDGELKESLAVRVRKAYDEKVLNDTNLSGQE